MRIFFKIDDDIVKAKSTEVAGEDAKAQRKLFLNEVVVRLKPVSEKYKDELIKRDVEVDITSSPVGLFFSMKKRIQDIHMPWICLKAILLMGILPS